MFNKKKKYSLTTKIFIINNFFFLTFFILFSFFPNLDILVANLFYYDDRFVAEHYPILKHIRSIFKDFMIFIPLVALTIILFMLINKKQKVLRDKPFNQIRINLMALGLLIGPIIGCGIIANLYFKDTWGRARPVHIEEFGGDKIYTPPFIKSDQCEKNCSWIGGEAAAAFSFITGILILKNPIFYIWFNLLFGLLVSILRMSLGGHFLSDNLFAAIFMIYLALTYKAFVLLIIKKKHTIKKFFKFFYANQ